MTTFFTPLGLRRVPDAGPMPTWLFAVLVEPGPFRVLRTDLSRGRRLQAREAHEVMSGADHMGGELGLGLVG